MRMRKKPNLQPRMERCAAVQIMSPELLRGRWHDEFPGRALWLEIGCGKGRFTVGTAQENPDGRWILPGTAEVFDDYRYGIHDEVHCRH